MGYIEDRYDEFISSNDFGDIGKHNIEVQQLIQMLYFLVNSYQIECYPVFRETDKSSTGFKVFNLRLC